MYVCVCVCVCVFMYTYIGLEIKSCHSKHFKKGIPYDQSLEYVSGH